MTGTPQDQKKAARIISQCRDFFSWYIPQVKDKYDLQAFDIVKAATFQNLGTYTDAGKLVEDRQKFSDKTLILDISRIAEMWRKRDPELTKATKEKSWKRECEQFQRIRDRRKVYI